MQPKTPTKNLLNNPTLERLTIQQAKTLAILQWITHNPRRELVTLGIALAPDGTPNPRRWAVQAVAHVVQAKWANAEDPGAGSIRLRITPRGRTEARRLAKHPQALPAGMVETIDPETPDVAPQRRRTPPPWIALERRGAITPRQSDAARALSSAIHEAAASGAPWLAEAVDTSPDHTAPVLAALRRVTTATRLLQRLTREQRAIVLHVVVEERSVVSHLGRIGTPRALAHLREGLNVVAVNAGIVAA